MKRLLFATAAAVTLATGAALVSGHDAARTPHPIPAAEASPQYDYDPPAPGSYRLPGIGKAADGTVLDHRGATRSLKDILTGRITVMAFVYTRCADICPLALTMLHEVHALASADPALRDRVQMAALSFDPAYDTPEVMAMHASGTQGADMAPFHFLTTRGEAALAPILEAYGQPVARQSDPDDPYGQFAHQLRVFLIDEGGTIRNIYSVGFLDPRLVMADIRTVVTEERREVAGR